MVKEWKRFMFLFLILAVGVCVFTGCGKSPSNEESSQVSEEKEKKIPYDFIEHLKKNIMLKLEKVKIVRCTGVWFKH